MNNISEETTKKKQIVSGLHLLRDYLSHSNKDSLNLSSQTLSRLKSFSTRLSNSGKEINSSKPDAPEGNFSHAFVRSFIRTSVRCENVSRTQQIF